MLDTQTIVDILADHMCPSRTGHAERAPHTCIGCALLDCSLKEIGDLELYVEQSTVINIFLSHWYFKSSDSPSDSHRAVHSSCRPFDPHGDRFRPSRLRASGALHRKLPP